MSQLRSKEGTETVDNRRKQFREKNLNYLLRKIKKKLKKGRNKTGDICLK